MRQCGAVAQRGSAVRQCSAAVQCGSTVRQRTRPHHPTCARRPRRAARVFDGGLQTMNNSDLFWPLLHCAIGRRTRTNHPAHCAVLRCRDTCTAETMTERSDIATAAAPVVKQHDRHSQSWQSSDIVRGGMSRASIFNHTRGRIVIPKLSLANHTHDAFVIFIY